MMVPPPAPMAAPPPPPMFGGVAARVRQSMCDNMHRRTSPSTVLRASLLSSPPAPATLHLQAR
jgi:hypothetical protein